MPHVIEPATSARSRCRGCSERIEKAQLRLGERLPNPFGEGEMTLWFHLVCGAYMRPEPFLEALQATTENVPDAKRLEAAARFGLDRRRLPRVRGAERAPTGRARCRCCRETIARDAWRIPLVYYEEGRFHPSGFIHAGCAREYFETADVLERATHFSPGLSESDRAELREALRPAEA